MEFSDALVDTISTNSSATVSADHVRSARSVFCSHQTGVNGSITASMSEPSSSPANWPRTSTMGDINTKAQSFVEDVKLEIDNLYAIGAAT